MKIFLIVIAWIALACFVGWFCGRIFAWLEGENWH